MRTVHPALWHGALWILPLLFAGRVFGQLAALLLEPAFLPPYAAWDSHTLPYPVLLGGQAILLALQAAIALDVLRGRGLLARRRPRLGRALGALAWLYAALMGLRWCLTMALVPELRWFGHAIPITFHFVLAGWLGSYAHYLRGEDGAWPAIRLPARFMGRPYAEGT